MQVIHDKTQQLIPIFAYYKYSLFYSRAFLRFPLVVQSHFCFHTSIDCHSYRGLKQSSSGTHKPEGTQLSLSHRRHQRVHGNLTPSSRNRHYPRAAQLQKAQWLLSNVNCTYPWALTSSPRITQSQKKYQSSLSTFVTNYWCLGLWF